jgi:cyclohexanone monooxygenase
MYCAPTPTPDDIDIDALRKKYQQERDRRLRPEGVQQYAETGHELADYYETDPHTPAVVRGPLGEEVDVAIMGGGFAGLLAAARLKEAGVASLRVVEMGGDFGGVWYWNRYPGIQCDNESYCYLPLLEETGYMPTARFVDGAEIYQHCKRIARHYGLEDCGLFGTTVRALRWDESIKRWRIDTNHGESDVLARFVVMAAGPLNRPKLPGVPGINSFKGKSFHSSRWDYAYTGGDASGGLTGLADKRVAVIGTGASAIQIVPFVGRYAKQLVVFQRTPSSVDERGNRPTDPDWVKSLPPGWQRARQRNFHEWAYIPFPPGAPHEDKICDFWTEVNRNLALKLTALGWPQMPPEQMVAMREVEDYRVMERLRRRVATIVADPATAEALKPYYRFLCKRPCSNDDYLKTFNRPNVALVDVSGQQGVERITETGVVAGGVEHQVDCIIYASGFEVTSDLQRRLGIEEITGRGGLSLYDHWAEGFRTFHGFTTRGFPNQFFTGFTQAGVGANNTAMYDQQATHIAYLIAETLKRGAATVEPAEEAQDDWVRTVRENAIDVSAFQMECTPSYFNDEGGRPGAGGKRKFRTIYGEPYPAGFYAFGDLIEAWRDEGGMRGLVLAA